MGRKTKSTLEVAAIYVVVLVMFALIVYPLLWAISISLNPGTSLFSAKLIPDNWSLVHYKWLFTAPNSNYGLWYKNTLLVAVLNAVLNVAVVSLLAYVFSRFRFVGRRYSIYSFLILQMFPVTMGMVAIYLLLNMVNLLDTFAGLILIYLGGGLTMNVFLVKGYMDTLPRDLDESAKMDGAGHMTIFSKILLPLTKPILAVVALFTFMAPFMDFLTPKIIIRSPEKYTLALGLFNLINDKFANNFTRFSAGTMLIALPIAIVFLFLQRYLITGLADGATKG
ncbi:sugar ABC transporter permease [Paenibacillus athensensis]|uniref:Sugar ABC transporter permease n=1 Tax=Paenibacillus athensensis TaxID=1967502 RepID=A0A4Y8Q967_9BACL|nr:sugar ABC transporter permease [Paenibacillus athensensis]MCD1260329.1 sugar ABC transporter permease [Paenibacillus athensensis]